MLLWMGFGCRTRSRWRPLLALASTTIPFCSSFGYAADPANHLYIRSNPPASRASIFKDASRDGSTVFYENSSGNPYVTTIGGITTEIVLPTDSNRFDKSVLGLSSGGSSVFGWTQYHVPNAADQFRIFRYSLSGTLAEYALVNGSNVSVVGSDETGRAIAGSYNTLLNGVYVRQAFVWRPDSNAFTMISGLEGPGSTATATGISGDGSTVIGHGELAGKKQAFRHTSGGGTQRLVTLERDNVASLVSRDGTVIGGQYNVVSPIGAPNAETTHAFRWTSSGGMQGLGTLGATYSQSGEPVTRLNAMNEVGSVLVGSSAISNSGATRHAFRWTSANGGTMEDLGTPSGGLSSEANDVSADGAVIVGQYASASNQSGGFYWTREGGMRSLDDALRAAGVSLAADVTEDARKISADGTVITGLTRATGAPRDVYFARLARASSGIITQDDLVRSLQSALQPQLGYETTQINLIYNGVGGMPMRNRLEPGKQAYWNTFDAGFLNRGGAEGGFGLGELGFASGFDGGLTARMALSGAYADLNLANDGHMTTRGFYLVPDFTAALSDELFLTMGAAFGTGQADITRGYLNGSALDFSSGSAETLSYGGKIRFDWLDAFKLGDTAFTPYTAFNYARISRAAYDETGGAFPATFERADNDMTIARVGFDVVHPLTDTARLLLRAEADYRFEDHAEETVGTVSGIGTFSLSGTNYQRVWLRGMLGGEFDIAGGSASLTLNATTQGAEPDLWLRAGWRKPF